MFDDVRPPAAKAKPAPAPKAKPAARKPAAAKPAPVAPAPKPAPAPTPLFDDPSRPTDGQLAAQELFVLAKSAGGTPTRAAVAPLQRRMQGVDPDGWLGPETRARADALAKQSLAWPTIRQRKDEAVPLAPDAQTAAQELAAYVNVYKGARAPRIAAYQRVLGVSTTGTVDAATRAAADRFGPFTWRNAA